MDIRTTPLIAAFNGPVEDPLYQAGAWDMISFYDLPLQLVGPYGGVYMATSRDHPTALSGYIAYSYYTRMTLPADGEWEIWACVSGGQLGAALESWRIAVWGGPYSAAGYTFLFGGGIAKFYDLRAYLGSRSSFNSLAPVVGAGYPSMMLLRRTSEGNIEGWSSDDDGANWTMRIQVPDVAPWGGRLYMALGIEDPTGGGLNFGCFGGGIPHRTQIYRILKALS
jgi:hypothetical protein